MISDNFMWFDGGPVVQGETTDEDFGKDYVGAFEITNFNFNVTAEDSSSDGGGGGGAEGGTGGGSSGKAKFGTFTVDKVVDTSSTQLYKAICLSTIFPSIMLAIRKSGGGNLVYLEYIFRYNQITGITWTGGSGSERPKETITFVFKAMGVQYVEAGPMGTPVSRSVWAWNTANQDSPTPDLTIPGVANAPKYILYKPNEAMDPSQPSIPTRRRYPPPPPPPPKR
jgi:type VI protein secretion system component Hcp